MEVAWKEIGFLFYKNPAVRIFEHPNHDIHLINIAYDVSVLDCLELKVIFSDKKMFWNGNNDSGSSTIFEML